jgi:hypothetical protein
VAKAAGEVCVRTPRARGGRVWDVEATTGAVRELAAHLVAVAATTSRN